MAQGRAEVTDSVSKSGGSEDRCKAHPQEEGETRETGIQVQV